MMCVASRIVGLAKRVRHVVLCMAINMPVISRLGNRGSLSIHRAESIRNVCATCGHIQVLLEKVQQNRKHCCLTQKIWSACEDYLAIAMPMAVIKHTMSHHHSLWLSSAALHWHNSGLLASEWLASRHPLFLASHLSARGGEAPTAQTQKGDAHGGTRTAPVPRRQRSKQFLIKSVAPAIAWRGPWYGTLAVDSHWAGVGEGVLEQVDGTKAKEDHRGLVQHAVLSDSRAWLPIWAVWFGASRSDLPAACSDWIMQTG